jgi:[ribosomal protein S5]-alanine N-acetyltransferase
MLRGERIVLRPVREEDWPSIEEWGHTRNGLWGSYQRHQLDHLPLLRESYAKTGLLKRDSGFLLIEIAEDDRLIGFVRYSLLPFPDADLPHPEIGFGITEVSARGKGYAHEAVAMLLDYLMAGYPAERITAFTDTENAPAKGLLEKLGFRCEGVLRRVTFRDGRWCDLASYSILREEWRPCAARAGLQAE